MTTCAQRTSLLALIEQACCSGARLRVACDLVGLHVRTVERWRRPEAELGDRRAAGKRRVTTPPNKLSDAERAQALQVLNSAPFKDLPPSQIVPRLADQGRYVASESTLYRLLREAGQLTHRRLECAAHQRH